jgi:hypothetical protein
MAAFASWYAQNPATMENLFQHLTPTALSQLEEDIIKRNTTAIAHTVDDQPDKTKESTATIPTTTTTHYYRMLAKVAIRRIAHKQLDKYASIAPPEQVQAALNYHVLPLALQTELWNKYGGSSPPNTWYDALERLREIANNNDGDNDGDSSSHLWRLVLDHPMTAYVPMQCQNCGHEVPDVGASSSSSDDSDIGLSEVDPTASNNNDDDEDCMQLLELRGGWFRGRPRAAKILQLDCPQCRFKSRWYRSGHPQVILNPSKWGRLCGEQEDLRLALANYLGIPIRTCVPLDWDHIWSEFGTTEDIEEKSNHASTRTNSSTKENYWQVLDDNARNFAVRLDEGIGAWTGVFGIHPDPSFCQDLTSVYLQCSTGAEERGDCGRADPCHSNEMSRYRKLVEKAQADRHGRKTQAKTVTGYLLHQAGMTSDDITRELQCAARDYGKKGWWEI